MKLWKRIAIMLFALMSLAGLAAAIMEVAGADLARWVRELYTEASGELRYEMLAACLGVAAVLAAYCVLVVVIAARAGHVRKARLLSLKDAGGDSVLLSQDTLDTLVKMAIGTPDGVSDVKITTGYVDHEAAVMIDIAVTSNINIPETTQAMQDRVRAQLSGTSGIRVSGVDVTISNIKVPEAGEPIVPVETVREEVVENGEILPEEETPAAETSEEQETREAENAETPAEEETDASDESVNGEEAEPETAREAEEEEEPASAEIEVPEADLTEDKQVYGEESEAETEDTQA